MTAAPEREPGSAPEWPGAQHVVVIGADTTTVRLYEELARAGERVLVVAPGAPDPEAYPDLVALGVELLEVPQVREADLRRVRVETAKAVVILGRDDVAAVRTALLVEEVNPAVRLVIEMANRSFGDRLAGLLGECVVLSPAELAAPTFVAAALADSDPQTFEIGGRMVVAGPADRVGGDRLAVLGDSAVTGVEALLPERGDIVLGTTMVGKDDRTVRMAGVFGAVRHVFDRRLRFVLLGLALLIVLSSLYFRLVGDTGWLVAIYLALTASTATGIGDVTDSDLPILLRFGAVAIQLFGLVLSAGITAVIVDLMISARLESLTGTLRGRPRHHVVICGLGRIGTSVALRLKQRGIAVVAIESDEAAPGVLRARAAKIPVIVARASDRTALETAGVGRADAVLAMTNDDAVNLEVGLAVKGDHPDVRVVTRVFDHDLAARVEKRLRIGATRSVAMLAAPAFAAAALGRRREVIFPVGRRVLLFCHVTVHPDSAAPGRRLAELDASGSLRVLAYAPEVAPLARQVLVYPATDLTLSSPSMALADDDAFLSRAALEWFGRQYVPQDRPGRIELDDPRVSPLHADDHTDLAPALILVGGRDPLHDDGTRYADALRATGVPVELRTYPDAIHGFMSIPRLSRDASTGADAIVDFLRP